MQLVTLLERLKMDRLEAKLKAVCEQAAERAVDYKTSLAQALETGWQGRHRRGIEVRLHQSRFLWAVGNSANRVLALHTWHQAREMMQ
jgi:hypothetical protein